jgi:hypothetical protein
MTGELAKPHWAEGDTNQLASFGPRSFFQIIFPVLSKQNRPPEPKMAAT